MPRVLLNDNPLDTDIKAKISEYITRRNMKVSDLIIRSGVGANTYYAGMKNPERFRLRDLRSVYDVLNVPHDERKGL